MYLFDNNSLKLYVAGEENIVRRVSQTPKAIWLSSVAAEESLIVHFSAMNRARSGRNSLSLPRAHSGFVQAVEDLRLLPILIYSEVAEQIFQTFTPATLRIGAQDCRIAAQAMAHGLVVVTRDLRHFEAIGADCEDWSAA